MRVKNLPLRNSTSGIIVMSLVTNPINKRVTFFLVKGSVFRENKDNLGKCPCFLVSDVPGIQHFFHQNFEKKIIFKPVKHSKVL